VGGVRALGPAQAALLATVAVAIAAVLGFLIARGSGGGSKPHPAATAWKAVSAGPLAASFPAGWQLQRSQAPAQLGLTDGIAEASGGRLIVVGQARTTDPSLLPARILGDMRGTPAPRLVTLRGATFYRYLNLSLRGQSESQSVYAVPTPSGTVLALCRTTTPDAQFAGICQQVVESIKLGSSSLGPGLMPAYAAALTAAIGRLDAARTTWGPRLSTATTASARASAARQLASADAQAGSAVTALSPGPASSANAALATALGQEAQAYSALALAAVHGRVAAYQSASTSVDHADTAVNSALAELRTLGYYVS